MGNSLVYFFFYSILIATPLLFATLGEILMEKNGSLNLGVEGTMAIGAIFGYLFAFRTQSLFVGLLAAFIFGGLMGLLYSLLTVTFKANQNVTGLAITIFGVALQLMLGTAFKLPQIELGSKLSKLIASKPFGHLAQIPYLGNIFFKHSALVYLAGALAIFLGIFIKHTKSGAKLRAVGENPAAADAVGIDVDRTRYIYTMIGSGIAGIGGLCIVLTIHNGAWNTLWINGYGWIAVALVIFSNWSPFRAIFASLLFGMLLTLSVHKSVLAAAYPKTLGFLSNESISEVYEMLPFILTAVIIVLSSLGKRKRNQAPASLGLNYFREDR